MKSEPIFIAAAYFTTSMATAVGSADPAMAMKFNFAIAVGGMLALLFSLWKSRKKKADGIDTALWAAIAFIGSMALAYFIAPVVEGRAIPTTDVVLTLPAAGFLITLSASPFIEWLLEGGFFKTAKHVAVKAGWIPETDCEGK